MSKNLTHEQSRKNIISRLHSKDANDRVKAAAELGEIGIEEDAPILLKVAYEDEASTVRQMAIQAYAEILEEDALDKILKAAKSHFDDYVRIYAINVLGNFENEAIGEYLRDLLKDENKKIQATVLRAMIHANSSNNAELVFDLLKDAENHLIIRNCIEALALWMFKEAKEFIEEFFNSLDDRDKELKIISAFYLAIMGSTTAINYLENARIDSLLRISYDNQIYRGKSGLLNLIKKLK